MSIMFQVLAVLNSVETHAWRDSGSWSITRAWIRHWGKQMMYVSCMWW